MGVNGGFKFLLLELCFGLVSCLSIGVFVVFGKILAEIEEFWRFMVENSLKLSKPS